jgi:histidinol phosphatase-like PHP family hydrolase
MANLVGYMKEYHYETHMHTAEASACATGTGAEMVRAYAEFGYSGVIITDHFFNGNTSIPEYLPWEKRIELFCKGYENALEEGEKTGIHVFFGWEYAFDGTEFLTYGLDKEFLLRNPDILGWSVEKYIKTVHDNGGFVVHAHPFREAYYIPKIRLYPQLVDGVEVINASHMKARFNERSKAFAEKHGLPQLSGSDSHHPDCIYGGGMAFDREIHTIFEFIEAVRSKTGYRLLPGVFG